MPFSSGGLTPGGLPVPTGTNVAPVVSTTATTATSDPRVTMQTGGIAPDSSGDRMVQYQATIGTTNSVFASANDAQNGLIAVATAQGYNNFVFDTTSINPIILLCW